MAKMKLKSENSKLVIAISSRALFNLDHSHKIFKEEGIEAVKWFNEQQSISMDTFSSITGVLEKYYNS